MNGWWYVVGASFLVSTALCLRRYAMVAAANPMTRLPLIGGVPNVPRGDEAWRFLIVFSVILGMHFVANALHAGGIFRPLCGFPFAAGVLLVGVVIPRLLHNGHVRRAALTTDDDPGL